MISEKVYVYRVKKWRYEAETGKEYRGITASCIDRLGGEQKDEKVAGYQSFDYSGPEELFESYTTAGIYELRLSRSVFNNKTKYMIESMKRVAD